LRLDLFVYLFDVSFSTGKLGPRTIRASCLSFSRSLVSRFSCPLLGALLAVATRPVRVVELVSRLCCSTTLTLAQFNGHSFASFFCELECVLQGGGPNLRKSCALASSRRGGFLKFELCLPDDSGQIFRGNFQRTINTAPPASTRLIADYSALEDRTMKWFRLGQINCGTTDPLDHKEITKNKLAPLANGVFS
jgi:hypothetical protein